MKTVWKMFLLMLTSILMPATMSVFASDLDDVVDGDFEKFFESDQDTIVQAERYKRGRWDKRLQWTTEDKSCLETIHKHKPGDVTAFGQNVEKITIRFFDKKPEEMMVVFYNHLNHKYHKDSDPHRERETRPTTEEFNATVNDVAKKLTELFGAEPVKHKSKIGKDNPTILQVWTKGKIAFVLRSSSKGGKKDFIGEFIDLRIFPFNESSDPRKTSYATQAKKNILAGKGDLTKNITRNDDGDVTIENIPAVVTSEFNGGLSAILERILRYYGNDSLTQNDLNSMFRGGGHMGFQAFIKEHGRKMGIKIRTEWGLFPTMKDYEKFFNDYNKRASRAKKDKVNIAYFKESSHARGKVMMSLDSDIVREMRAKEKADCKKFKKDVCAGIDAGFPVIWTVHYLWAVPELRQKLSPRDNGERMLLVQGYNDKEGVVYFVNPWDAKQQLQKIAFDEAWIMTSHYIILEPR